MSAARHPGLELQLPVWRSRVLLLVLLATFVALAGRAVFLQGLHNDFLRQKGESRYSRVIDLAPTRGMIVDRNNEALAISTPVESVAASPADVAATPEELARLARLTLLLLAVLIGCALALVTSQHRARKLYVELQKEQELTRQLDVEWGQLQLEQSTWAMHARIEKVATQALGMRVPPSSRVQMVPSAAGERRP